MSEIKNSALDQYGTEPSEQQQFGTAGVEGVKMLRATFGNHCCVFSDGRAESEVGSSEAEEKGAT